MFKLKNKKITPWSFYCDAFYQVSDNFAIAHVSKNCCSTVILQSKIYHENLNNQEFLQYEYKHIGELFNENYKYKNLFIGEPKKVFIFRDPIERLISAYNTKVLNNKFNIFFDFLLEVKKTFDIVELNSIDQHINLQINHITNFDSIDIFVNINDYNEFCEKNNIQKLEVNKNSNIKYQSEISLSNDEINLIKEIYKSDYEFIKKIKKSNKLYISSK